MFIALDLETTGLDSRKDKIIEVALVRFDPVSFDIHEEYSTLINPGIHIPELNSSITNIYDKDVADAPKWPEVLQKISDFIWDCPIVWHNVYFDTGFLSENGIGIEDNLVLDTFLISNFLVLWEKSLSLEYLCKYFKIPLLWAHRALNDTKASIELFKKLVWRISEMSFEKKQILHYILNKSSDGGMRFLSEKYVDIDDALDSEESFIKKIESLLPKREKYKKIKTKKDSKDFDFKDTIGKQKNIEVRENQNIMADIVYNTIEEQKFSAIEAPTGIWKTFAYLIPAIVHSLKTWEQVFVSTSTKALQDQIYYTDLINISKNTDLEFTYSKLKGKRNYVWILSFLNFVDAEEHMTLNRTSFILKILLWLWLTVSWELDELDYYGQEFSFLHEINADDALTFSNDNTYLDQEFAVRARRQSKSTNIVIINNNILFQDINGEWNILWKVENLIVDEAHNFEDVLTQSLQKNFCMEDLEKNLLKIERKLAIEKEKNSHIAIKREKLLFELALLFDVFQLYLWRKAPENSKYRMSLIKNDFFDSEGKEVLKNNLESTLNMLFIDYLDTLKLLPDEIYNKISREMLYVDNSLEIVSKCIAQKSIWKYICYMSYSDTKWLTLQYTHLHPWDYLKNHLWKSLSSCVLTSATLKSGSNFDYIDNMLWLEKFDFHELETDFDYSKQALLYIPDDIGSVKNNFINVTHFIQEFMQIVKWKTLVLFTSFHSIKEAYVWLEKELKKDGIQTYAQSIWWWKQKLIDFYKQNAESSLLIGTNTFWEWVDIPWDKLKYLIIHKVPFMVPTDPIFQARSALFKDSFSEYAIPKAVIKLKQGFWRLIRTKKDSGIVVFMDDRIYSSGWWASLFDAFPKNINKKIASQKDFLDVLKVSKK